ncbi:MAG: exodeoxyribonuclease VII large subunit [Phycisphaeraceae bacterium]|nr:MAG: exodeoxyribonuclease VII large subunit [Phycisphaeraceae bacterium]
MGRLPFDPDRMKGAKPARPKRDPDIPLSISALASLIERAIGDVFPKKITVRGEVSGARERTHWYFNLKDENAVIGAVFFASAARKSAVTPRDGRVVIASGRIEYYAPQGRLSLVVDSLKEDGEGSLDAQFRALCEQFRAQGWFDPEAKKPLPTFPSRIAVLTSASSAALQDVLDTTKRRCPAVDLLLVDTLVQGDRAAPIIARTIRRLDAYRAGLSIDAILLTRGGGSAEDLWCFNDPDLARAIHDCRIPIVAAIGHESDTTIAELVADRRAATPTQAAMLLTPDREALARQLHALAVRQSRTLRVRLDAECRHLRALAGRPVLADPTQIAHIQADRLGTLGRRLVSAQSHLIHAHQRRLARLELGLERRRPAAEHARRAETIRGLSIRLRGAMHHALADRRRDLGRLAAVRDAIGPTAVLNRGFSITTTATGSLVRSVGDAGAGDRLTTRLADGELHSTIDGAATPTRRPRRPRRANNPDRDVPPQMDLFDRSE